MYGFIERDSELTASTAIYDLTLQPGIGWMHALQPGQSLRVVDLEGNQAVDVLFYSADDLDDHYSAVTTIATQKNIYLTTGSILRTISGRPMLEITADKTGRHDTIGGCCASQSNTVRYAMEKAYMHNCRDTFMLQFAKHPEFGIEKRDFVPNLNFFMNVPVTPEGELEFIDGISAPGKYLELKALSPVVVVMSNCTQMNNPCNDYNPTPVRLLIWDA